ncbi:MAG: hypothetical protein IT371_20330 [Deltaproteobacteria bacterium]|nr:hypothetical protein [Deltaproteobacteria bacterium]
MMLRRSHSLRLSHLLLAALLALAPSWAMARGGPRGGVDYQARRQHQLTVAQKQQDFFAKHGNAKQFYWSQANKLRAEASGLRHQAQQAKAGGNHEAAARLWKQANALEQGAAKASEHAKAGTPAPQAHGQAAPVHVATTPQSKNQVKKQIRNLRRQAMKLALAEPLKAAALIEEADGLSARLASPAPVQQVQPRQTQQVTPVKKAIETRPVVQSASLQGQAPRQTTRETTKEELHQLVDAATPRVDRRQASREFDFYRLKGKDAAAEATRLEAEAQKTGDPALARRARALRVTQARATDNMLRIQREGILAKAAAADAKGNKTVAAQLRAKAANLQNQRKALRSGIHAEEQQVTGLADVAVVQRAAQDLQQGKTRQAATQQGGALAPEAEVEGDAVEQLTPGQQQARQNQAQAPVGQSPDAELVPEQSSQAGKPPAAPARKASLGAIREAVGNRELGEAFKLLQAYEQQHEGKGPISRIKLGIARWVMRRGAQRIGVDAIHMSEGSIANPDGERTAATDQQIRNAQLEYTKQVQQFDAMLNAGQLPPDVEQALAGQSQARRQSVADGKLKMTPAALDAADKKDREMAIQEVRKQVYAQVEAESPSLERDGSNYYHARRILDHLQQKSARRGPVGKIASMLAGTVFGSTGRAQGKLNRELVATAASSMGHGPAGMLTYRLLMLEAEGRGLNHLGKAGLRTWMKYKTSKFWATKGLFGRNGVNRAISKAREIGDPEGVALAWTLKQSFAMDRADHSSAAFKWSDKDVRQMEKDYAVAQLNMVSKLANIASWIVDHPQQAQMRGMSPADAARYLRIARQVRSDISKSEVGQTMLAALERGQAADRAGQGVSLGLRNGLKLGLASRKLDHVEGQLVKLSRGNQGFIGWVKGLPGAVISFPFKLAKFVLYSVPKFLTVDQYRAIKYGHGGAPPPVDLQAFGPSVDKYLQSRQQAEGGGPGMQGGMAQGGGHAGGLTPPDFVN